MSTIPLMMASAGRRGPPDTLEKLGLAPSPALSGAYIVYGELHSFIAVHIEHLLIIYLTQQSLNLRLDQRALESSPQDKILEKLDESIQAVFATIRHNPHVLLILRLPRFKRGLQHRVQDHRVVLKVRLGVFPQSGNPRARIGRESTEPMCWVCQRYVVGNPCHSGGTWGLCLASPRAFPLMFPWPHCASLSCAFLSSDVSRST